MTFDGGIAVIEGGRPVHLTSPGGLATGTVVFGASGIGLLLIAYDPSLFARWKWIFVGLGVAMVTGVTLLSLGVR
jgi:multisubunit Na+/H+ antiporter MnhB subunit